MNDQKIFNFVATTRKSGVASICVTLPKEFTDHLDIKENQNINLSLLLDTYKEDTIKTSYSFISKARKASQSSLCVTLDSLVTKQLKLLPGDILKVTVEKDSTH